MKKGFKTIALVFALAFTGLCGRVFAQQQITKFAVVDMARIYQAYYKNSTAVRNYERKRQEFQTEIDNVTREIQNLKQKKLEYDRKGDKSNSQALAQQISEKTSYLTEYTSTKQTELDNLRNSLQNNDAFYKKLYSTIQTVAQKGGYSMVMSLQQANAIIWYSPSVDLTNAVIKELGLRL
ncbi:MAG: OmpH family outer membrane protein [Treponema sp.]|nr:OmpH family outer membrane protein [Treponema sp.]MBQ2551465.1 OmpH family outer membrane protein [Treponema sp.]MBQ4235253.1 OmpH family outer membrane protein [Treponema sp.]MBQ5384394.1 OmpH family outer membrane protein [Treponema sp.]